MIARSLARGKHVKRAKWCAALVATAVLSTNDYGQIDYAAIQIISDKMAPNLYMLSGSAGVDQNHQDGAGGRIGVLAGPDGGPAAAKAIT